jgi:hypothetical protein
LILSLDWCWMPRDHWVQTPAVCPLLPLTLASPPTFSWSPTSANIAPWMFFGSSPPLYLVASHGLAGTAAPELWMASWPTILSLPAREIFVDVSWIAELRLGWAPGFPCHLHSWLLLLSASDTCTILSSVPAHSCFWSPYLCHCWAPYLEYFLCSLLLADLYSSFKTCMLVSFPLL